MQATIIKRPTVTQQIKLEAAKQLITEQHLVHINSEHIADCAGLYDDGFEIAKSLEENYGYQLCVQDVSDLDCYRSYIDELLRKAEKKWFKENDIKPPLAIGTQIKQGVIKGIYEHEVARYLVQQNGCTDLKRSLIIKFEDAVAVEQPK